MEPTQRQDDLPTIHPTVVVAGAKEGGEGNGKEEGNLKQHVIQVGTRATVPGIREAMISC
jgi:hypothetical protein